MRYYKSGSSRGADILAFGHILRQPLGVVAGELRPPQLALLASMPHTPLFIDSGAFGEVDGELNVVKPITHDDWLRVLDVYEHLSRALGPAVTVVAPDMIGDQLTTLRRMERYAERVYECVCLGARALVPVQTGAVPASEFYGAALEALGVDDDPRYVPALPMKRGATTIQQLRDFVAEARPAELHLLGLGPKSRRFKDALAACWGVSVTCDSNGMKALIGRKGKKPRPLTLALDKAEQWINSKLGPQIIKAHGVEMMLEGASSEEAGDRFAAWANAGYTASGYIAHVWPMRGDLLRKTKKTLAICEVYGQKDSTLS